jgi:hypothetical protein
MARRRSTLQVYKGRRRDETEPAIM